MSKIYIFFLKLILLTLLVASAGFALAKFEVVTLPSMFYGMVAFYFIISTMAFMVNIKAMEKEDEIAVWYYMASIMSKFLLAAISVVVLTKFFPEQKKNIVFTSFALYPLYEALVIFDVYKRIRS
jgi:hypothetical protein